MSLSGNPASRKRFAIASEAAVTLPTESVVLISISCLKMSTASRRVAWSDSGVCCACIETVNTRQKKTRHRVREPTFILHQELRNEFAKSSGSVATRSSRGCSAAKLSPHRCVHRSALWFRTLPRLKANRFIRQNQARPRLIMKAAEDGGATLASKIGRYICHQGN